MLGSPAMDDNDTDKKPRSAVVVKTADGRRLKPKCPMCGRTYWGKLVPPGVSEPEKVRPLIPAQVGDVTHGIEIQQWVCLNCGFLWHLTGATSPKEGDR